MSEKNVVPQAGQAGSVREGSHVLPSVNVLEDAAGITLYADLPGVPRDRLALHVDGETLTIEGEIVLSRAEDARPTHVEVAAPRYRRVFTLSRELDADHIDASFEAGVLKLRIPRAAHAQPRKVEIRTA